VKTDKET